MAILSGWCLIACLSVFFAGITAITETRYVRAGTDETLSCPINGTVVTAGWFYYESRDGYTGDFIYIAVKSNPDTSYPRKDRIAVMYDRNNGVYDLTLLNFNGQTDVGLFACSTVMQNSEVFYHYYTVEFADGPSTASITGNVPVFADDSSSLTLICAATANPGVTFQWKNGNNIIGYSNNLTLSPAREDNGLTVTCTAINMEYDDIRASDSVTLEVYYGPKSVTITGRPVYADGTNRLTLTCTAEEYSPGVEFQWKEGSQNINEQNTNTYTKIADKTDNGRTLTCLTWNTMFSNKRKETSRQLTVYSTDTDDLKTKEINVMTLAGAVSGSVGVLLIVIATVVLWRRGVISKLNSSCRKNNESTGQDVYQNQAFDPVSAERNSTNEAIYQEIGPSENPAMHYASLTH